MQFNPNFVFKHIIQDDVDNARSEAEHITLQIRDAYLQVITRWNKWTNPWEHLDLDYFDERPNEMLLQFLEDHRLRQKAWRKERKAKLAQTQRAIRSVQWRRPAALLDRYRVIDGKLHEVRERVSLDGSVAREAAPHPVRSDAIQTRGERIGVAVILDLLGNPPKKTGRPRKGPRYRARLRINGAEVYLGTFDTELDRDAAVLNARLGLTLPPNLKG